MALSSSLFVNVCRCWGQKWGQGKQLVTLISFGSHFGEQVNLVTLRTQGQSLLAALNALFAGQPLSPASA